MAPFDPYTQSVHFLAADGVTPLDLPIPVLDAFNEESVSICLNYGAQIGACFMMLLTVLIMTPTRKLRRVSTLLHIAALAVCLVRMVLLGLYFPSPWNEFYNVFAQDWSSVGRMHFAISVAANTFSLLLVVAIEAALMNQAWAMVVLWPPVLRFVVAAISCAITLLTISWRLAFTIIQNRAVITLTPPESIIWLIYWVVGTNSISICWYTALFNAKLAVHLIRNRGVLPKSGNLTPMEVLVMTNGVLMIVPVIFTGLEWGRFTNFESASLTLTSVALILPLGTLAARRMARSNGIVYADNPCSCASCAGNSPFDSHRHHHPHNQVHHHHHDHMRRNGLNTASSSCVPLAGVDPFASAATSTLTNNGTSSSYTVKKQSWSTDSGPNYDSSTSDPKANFVLSRCEAMPQPDGMELSTLQSPPMVKQGVVRVEREIDQHEERI